MDQDLNGKHKSILSDSHQSSLDETIVSARTGGFGAKVIPEIPGYQIIRELGQGAMGSVYLAKQLSVDRNVAIKTINGQEKEIRKRFHTEAEAVGRLQHPNIVQMFDYGEANGRPYFSVELIDGGSLDKHIEQNPPSPRKAVQWIETLARALHYAHEKGIVHRDMKPSNVLISKTGTLKISDFGLAKQTDIDTTLTQVGDIIGTPHYMSPEQASGNKATGNPAVDIYALGAMLYDMLVGHPPFAGPTIMETLDLIRYKEPESLRKQNSQIDQDLEKICLKCLQKRPEDRYDSALDVAEDLRCYLDGEPVKARPISITERGLRSVKRSPTVTALVAALVFIGLGSLFYAIALTQTAADRNQIVQGAEQRIKASETAILANKALALKIPLGLKAISVPSDNPLTVAKVELGHKLFFDKRLSIDDSVSCATCHNPTLGWTDARPVATGIGGQKGIRSTPTIINTAHQNLFFWDGRAENFEEQALGPLLNPLEMGNPSAEYLSNKIGNIPGYKSAFNVVFEDGVNAINISKAIAAFERTIMAGNTPYDRFRAGDQSAISQAAQRGMKLFFNKANCSACHAGAYLTDGGFHNVGLDTPEQTSDVGREALTNLLGDRGTFKTPTLREIARTAPYMHDGRFQRLADVVEHYNQGGSGHPQQDEEIYALGLSDQQKRDLVTFLKEGLSSPDYPVIEPPVLPLAQQ